MSDWNEFLALRRVAGFALALLLLPLGAASAAEPKGEWLVADKNARIRIADCDGTMWGVVSWEADPGVDAKNPDPAKRSRPTLGMPVLLGMKPDGKDRWSGRIYNSDNGKFYSGGIAMLADDRLRVRGCILGFLCGGENWTRFKPDAGAAALEPEETLCLRLNETR